MILGTGTDLCEVHRIEEALREYGERFERRVFTEGEIAYCRSTPRRRAERYAARFAAKEALSKAIGTGIRMGTRWRDIEVVKEPSGRPVIRLHGRLAERFADVDFQLSLTHTDTLAMAVVIASRTT